MGSLCSSNLRSRPNVSWCRHMIDEPCAKRNVEAVEAHGSKSRLVVRGSIGVADRRGGRELPDAERCRAE